MRSTVCSAVPDGASIFWSWWSSMTSAVSKHGAASSAKRTMSTAPMAKLAAITALALDASNAGAEVVDVGGAEPGGADDRVHAVVGAPGDVVAGGVDDGEVDRDLGTGVEQRVRRARDICRLASIPHCRRSSPRAYGSTAATSSSSGSSSTAWHTVAPMRPAAPNTPTLIMPACGSRRHLHLGKGIGRTHRGELRSPPPSTRSITRPMSSAVTASTCSTTQSRLGHLAHA